MAKGHFSEDYSGGTSSTATDLLPGRSPSQQCGVSIATGQLVARLTAGTAASHISGWMAQRDNLSCSQILFGRVVSHFIRDGGGHSREHSTARNCCYLDLPVVLPSSQDLPRSLDVTFKPRSTA